MENYIKKAADAFLVERPYGMRVDYRKKGFVLFNRNLNVLGNAEQTRLEELPLERFNVERFRWRVKSWRNTQDLPMYSSIPI